MKISKSQVLCAAFAAGIGLAQAMTQEIAVWRGETVAVPLRDDIESPRALPERPDIRLRIGSAYEVRYLTKPNGHRYESCLDKVVWDGGRDAHRWIEIAASPDARPGVCAFGDLTVRVVDETLPPPRAWRYYLDLWQHPWAVSRYYGVKPFSPEHYARMAPLWKTLASAGQKTITVSLLEQPWNHQCHDAYHPMVRRVRRADGSWSFDYALFDEYVKFALGCGLGPDISCYTMCPWGYKVSWEDEKGVLHRQSAKPGEPFFEAYWQPFLKDFREHVKKMGWLGRTYISMDERSPEDVRIICGMIAREAPGLKTSMAGNKNPASYSDITIDSFSCSLRRFTPELLAEAQNRRNAGRITTFYICCSPAHPNTFMSSDPEEAFFVGAYPAFGGLDGVLRWAWNSWPLDPDRDASFSGWMAGDTYLVYPDNSPSVRFLSLRRGIVAAEKVRILKEKGRLDGALNDACVKAFDLKSALEARAPFAKIVRDVEKLANPSPPSRK